MDNVNSILDSTKKALGIHPESTDFDLDVVMHINSSLFLLNQLGVGPSSGFRVTGNTDTWDDFLGMRNDLESAKSFVFINVRLLFDRPETSYGIQALEKQRDEYGWRLELQARQTPEGG